MPSTEVATRTNMSIPEGFEEFGSSDMILPVYRIVQPVSQGVEPKYISQFINGTTKEVVPSLDVVILKWQHSRAYFQSVADRAPACSSDDGLHPRVPGRVVGNETIPKECVLCPFGAWLGDMPPSCKSGYMLICADTDTGDRFIYRAMGTSAGPVKRLLNQIIAKKTPLYGVTVKLATIKGESDKGNYYVLQPTIEQVMSSEGALAWRGDYLAVKGALVKEAAEESSSSDLFEQSDASPAEEIPY